MKKKVTKKEVLRLHQATGIPTHIIKRDMGIIDIEKVLADAKSAKTGNAIAKKLIREALNFEEIKFVTNSGQFEKQSEEQLLAEKKCELFGLKILRTKKTVKDVSAFWNEARELTFYDFSESAFNNKIIDKWNRLTVVDLKLANALEDVMEVWRDSYNPLSARNQIEKKLEKLINAAVANAKNLDEALYAHKFVIVLNYQSETVNRATDKVLSFITNFNQALQVFDETKMDKAFYRCLEYGSIDQLSRLYSNFSKYENSNLERVLLSKIESLAIKQLPEMTQTGYARSLYYSFSNRGSDQIKQAIALKLYELAVIELESISNLEELKKFQRICPDHPGLKKLILEKMLVA